MASDLARQGVVPQTVIDVGANVGQFAIAAAKHFPSAWIYSFEPIPETLDQLRANLKTIRNVTIFPFALGASEMEVAFNVNADSRASSVLHLAQGHLSAAPAAIEVRQISAKLSTLDTVFRELDLKSPVLLKLDVQGYEARVLEGGRETLKRIDFVIAEASFKPMYEGEVLFLDMVAMMKNRGFDFLRPVGWLSNPKTGEILQMDMLFARR